VPILVNRSDAPDLPAPGAGEVEAARLDLPVIQSRRFVQEPETLR